MTTNIKIDSKLIHFMLLFLILLLFVISLGGAYFIVNSLHAQANNLVSLKAKDQALNTEQANLIIAKEEVKKYSSLEKIAQTIVPQNKDQAQAVREIVDIAQQSNITLTAIVFPSSTLGNTPVPTTPGTSPTAANPSLSLSQLTPVKGIPGVYILPIQVEDTQKADAVTYSSFYTFLSKLEQNRLTSEVTGLNIQPLNPPSRLITFSLTINEYIKPR